MFYLLLNGRQINFTYTASQFEFDTSKKLYYMISKRIKKYHGPGIHFQFFLGAVTECAIRQDFYHRSDHYFIAICLNLSPNLKLEIKQ